MEKKELRTEEELEAMLKDAKTRVPLGLYTHYKNGKQYLVTGYGVARYQGEVCVIYEAQYGKRLTYIRTLAEWFLPGDNGELRFIHQ